MVDARGGRARHGGRLVPMLMVAAIGAGVAGCSATVTATPVGTSSVPMTITTPASSTSAPVVGGGSAGAGSSGAGSSGVDPPTASSTVAQPNLTLDISFARGSETPSDAELAASISAVLGDVPALTDQQRTVDPYIGSLDGAERAYLTLPDATPRQLGAARDALVGTRGFGLRPVVRSVVDAEACSALQATPRSDQLCDPATREVLTLGKDLGVRPTRVQTSTGQESPGATLTFVATDAETIAAYTAAHVGERLAMTDGLVLVTAPTIQAAITDGRIAVSGAFTSAQAGAIVGKLQLAVVGATISTGP